MLMETPFKHLSLDPKQVLVSSATEVEGMNFEEQLLATKCRAQKIIYTEPYVQQLGKTVLKKKKRL